MTKQGKQIRMLHMVWREALRRANGDRTKAGELMPRVFYGCGLRVVVTNDRQSEAPAATVAGRRAA